MNKRITYAIIAGLLALLFWFLVRKRPKRMQSVNYIVNDLLRHPTKDAYHRRSLDQIDQIVIHHSATNGGDPWSYARYHVEKNDWPGIGYHFVIQPGGTVYQTNDLETISYHTSGENANSIGICLTGNFDLKAPSFNQQEKLVALCQELNQMLGRKLVITGHNQFSAKSCPGSRLDLEAIRQLVNPTV